MLRFLSKGLTAVALVCGVPTVVEAAVLTSSGTITDIRALQDSQPTATPTGRLAVGDSYTLTANFQLSDAILTPLFDADPTTNIYYLPGAYVTFNSNDFSRSFVPLFDFNASAQLWNDRDVVGLTDSQTFSFFDYNISPEDAPFDLGAGLQSISLGIYAFDFTATARNSDLISMISPFELFSSKSFSLGHLNSDTNLFVSVSGSVDAIALAPDGAAVPEPALWVTLILGFALVGSTLRRRQKGGLAVAA